MAVTSARDPDSKGVPKCGDLNTKYKTAPSEVINLEMTEDDSLHEVTQLLRSHLELNGSNRIIRVRNFRESLIPLNGKIVLMDNNDSPFTLEVVEQFQTVTPKPCSLELTQYAECLKHKILGFQDRLTQIESCMENLMEKRQDKVQQEISKLENTVNFIKKRMEDAETIEWKGMFVKNPLW